jgi:uncharacterized protein (TIGR04255 family)
MWVPASESHSIERVAVIYLFKEPLPSKFVQNASAYADGLMAEGKFIEKRLLQEANLQLYGAEALSKNTESVGYTYVDKSGEEALKILKDRAQFSATEYGTWKAFSQEADKTVGPFVSKALTLTGIRSIKLEYVDRFIFEGPISDVDYSEMLQMDKLGLPEEARGGELPWHDRKGWFTKWDMGNVLINLNVSASDVAPRDRPDARLKSIQIVTVSETRFSETIDQTEVATGILEKLHDLTKETFRSVMTEKAANLVGLV